MTSRDFCYWLQGWLEIRGNCDGGLSATQLECVAKHLSLVFAHEIDPIAGPKEVQDKLNHLHGDGAVKVRC